MMSKTFEQVIRLIERGDVKVSDHGYDELTADALSARDTMVSVREGTVAEDYPDPAVLVTAYRPDPARWEPDLLRRKK